MTRRDLFRLEIPFAAIGIGLIAAAIAFAATSIPTWIPDAPLVRIGVPSPVTGMTRSFVALASGDLGAALRWHPLGPLVFAAALAAPVVAAVSWVRGGRLALTRVLRHRSLWIAVAVAFTLAWARQLVVL